jgi:hypothetical protein
VQPISLLEHRAECREKGVAATTDRRYVHFPGHGHLMHCLANEQGRQFDFYKVNLTTA